ncbi:sensor histidine kinase KdpD [Tolypothrix sp. PCC 7910]|uniref:sensor protein KdpD n=1 Tax=Tolypothrix sp. PCC 7910 TaxID=2099387 RepID=UPI0014278BA7|nr:universal stress protein [Tolypothrix sp. PCC 7910]QIR38524.1 sensor histidine kinase KdpD [Tolypothrix sp. PCC 7910]
MLNPSNSSPDASYIRPQRRGKHKIFIGMAPGVGKTYKMLEEAHQLKQDGIDVVIGILETHGRKETAQKAAGLEVIPRKTSIRQNITLEEMDIEAILVRSPQLVLVDELAHTNIPGSPREKRYQDVEVILNAGIDVYSTVNIQHLESLNDVVARITSVVVRERIPDRLLEEADAVVVIDVTPETLEERLREGKIYGSNKIEQSLENFFQRRNLIALRELALREVADTVEEEANTSVVVGQTCNIHERVLVCVSTYPNSVQLLRRGARIANYMNARFYAVFVADPERFLTKEESLHMDTCEKLCREFGGEFLHVKSQSVAQTIAQVATDYHITQIVIGESQQPRWKRFFKRPFTQRLMELIRQQNIDLHIIATKN